ncbi:hypothetical protein PLICBS_004086 [Purpureocillium lilacinum]|uniref:uncharacterized protein n=1 Tax=Purpureocillium lilacinum TaxID=33203 RepID=UPI00207FA909|nr:hypothetical protein PLICBS_004086 [Purpureocillium lilacinum]
MLQPGSGPSSMWPLPVPRLNWTARNGGCPVLENALCIKPNTTPVVMDSSFINSNDHLGVNAEPKDTIEYRRIATCAPLEGTHAFYNKSEALALGYQFEYYYGHNYILGTNYTFEYGVINRFRVGDYRLASFEKPNSTMFDRTDAKISLFFLITDYLRYYAPVYDMWFLKSNSFNESTLANTSDGPVELWEPFHFVRIMACEEVHQRCNRSLPGAAVDQCANFTLAVDQVALSQKMALSPRQNSTWVRLRAALLETSLFDIAWKLSKPIDAARSVLDGSQYAKLPVNQWRREVGRWFSTG